MQRERERRLREFLKQKIQQLQKVFRQKYFYTEQQQPVCTLEWLISKSYKVK